MNRHKSMHAKKERLWLGAATLIYLVMFAGALQGHDGPDPIFEWNFDERSVIDGAVRARLGPHLVVEGKPTVVTAGSASALYLDGKKDRLKLVDAKAHEKLPKKAMTVATWVAVNESRRYGGILGWMQDNNDYEKGWVLGYDEQFFTFALASQGADDGNGKLTYLSGTTQYEKGKLYHVVATYDGVEMRLYVNGKLESTSKAQSGDILYPEAAPWSIGGYRDDNEDFLHGGRLRQLALYDVCARPAWVQHVYEHDAALAAEAAFEVLDPEFRVVVPPYLQFVTQTGITVMGEYSRPAQTVIEYGETSEFGSRAEVGQSRRLFEATLTGLRPETQYFYRVVSVDSEARTLTSSTGTFQTANRPETPFAFVVISDTQSNPEVARKIAAGAWGQRPNFVLHPGDLVGTGSTKSDWTEQFFPSMGELIGRVAFFPVLGNHEQNARHYYEYMSLPEPEYYYEFHYGNSHFFMIDTNKNVGSDSDQYGWLDQALAKSKARWKFVCHHHPPYSSDENDYGDLWKGKSTHGDLRVRQLTPLYDKHGVDVVWCGHIHSYERTWPLRGDRAVERNGTIYMITGGGGGSLETPGPTKPWFQNNVKRGHHYCLIAINGGTLEFKAFDLEGRLFDWMKIEKKAATGE